MNKLNGKAVENNLALKAGAWYVISSIFVKAISIITTPLFTRLLTTEEYGVTATFSSWYTILLTFCTLNLTYSIGRAKLDYPGKLNEYIGAMQVLAGLVTLVGSVVVLIFIKPLAAFFELPVIGVILLLLYLFFSPAISFFQNGCRYRYQYKENIGVAWYTALTTVALSLGLILCLDGDKAVYRMVGIVMPTVVLSTFFWIKAFRHKSLNCNKEYWKYGLAISLPLILHTVSLNILAQSDRIFIVKLCGAADTGIYSLIYNYGMILTIVTSAVSDGWLPWFHDNYYAKNYNAIRKNVKLVVGLGCYVGLASIALAPEAILILGGKEYTRGVYCIPPIVLGVICRYIYTHYVNIELHLKKTKYVSMGTVFAAGLNLILNSIFIPKFGYVAAAYTTFGCYFVLLIVHFIITRKVLQIKLYNDWIMFGSMIVTAIVAVVIIFSYSVNYIRYGLIVVGFISFLWVYRSYIAGYLRKIL